MSVKGKIPLSWSVLIVPSLAIASDYGFASRTWIDGHGRRSDSEF